MQQVDPAISEVTSSVIVVGLILHSLITVDHLSPLEGLRRTRALLKARRTDLLSSKSLKPQPTTIRKNKSIKTVPRNF